MMRLVVALIFSVAISFSATALNVEEPLPNAQHEELAQRLFKDIRCMSCQGESIADSPSKMAGDVRRTVRQYVAQGQAPETILNTLTNVYGDAILMRPPVTSSTMILWFGPLLLLMAGSVLVWCFFRSSAKSEAS